MAYFPDNILTALKEAVINVFWKKMMFATCFPVARCHTF